MTAYCPDLFHRVRRASREVDTGGVGLGGDHPVRVQSMLTSDTRDVAACVAEALELVGVGCEIVRITAQTRQIASHLADIVAGIRAAGSNVPVVADIHFKPDAALEAAKWVQKVRVNPGNYADKKKFQIRDYTDDQYAEELGRIVEEFSPLVRLCQERGVAMRIGTNHGSLSDRIMNRYGDTPDGMVESALEFARIARSLGYHQFAFSMKSSNPKVMIGAYRLLASRLAAEGSDWNYPLHLGVTEAGDGEDGRIKSAIGIGSLLADGLGDTIRVSLTEDAIHEIPVARALLRVVDGISQGDRISEAPVTVPWDPFVYSRRRSQRLEIQGLGVGGEELVRVAVPRAVWDRLLAGGDLTRLGDCQPEIIHETAPIRAIDPRDPVDLAELEASPGPVLVTVRDGLTLAPLAAFRLLAARIEARHPILLKDTLHPEESQSSLDALLGASVVLGALLCDGIGDAVLVRRQAGAEESVRLAYNILQAAGTRIFKTDYVACPSCGRTLFNLQTTTQKVRAATGHLKGLRIAVMGCIVNGPGEMADADFGYVGGAPGKINLYLGKEAVKFNLPEEHAVECLVDLIKEHGRWVDP
ncbi:MAG: (E)-4-hydroxy-3-methylbut-2-enyl-diphosphate synthase [Akkermansiaceae bacterium]|nr:(E)-4-hydroxy-3-methylbut-2-enyl-diphosphate synthase [Akkermansiaceae bacterium]